MANPEHLAKFREGQFVWSSWRHSSPKIKPDLSDADFSLAALQHFDLTNAELTRANFNKANMRYADLTNANMNNANLSQAHLVEASLMGASLREVNANESELRRANLSGASLVGATLVEADLRGAILFRADLSEANLRESDLLEANLSRAVIRKSNLVKTDLRSVNLQYSALDNSNITGAKLWETQRAEWSISGIICEFVYWDRDAKIPTRYKPGEFERLFCNQTLIELFYEGGISTFELNTLPALLQHLASKHPDANVHLKTMEQTGGGAKITISLGDADEQTRQAIRADADQVQQIQLSLRESEGKRLQLEANFNRMLETFTHALLTSAPSQIHFHAPVQTAALPSGNAIVELHQTFNDNTELIQLIDKLLTRNTELTATQSVEIESAKAELQKPNPDRPLLTRTLDFLKSLPKEAILKGVGKLGEKAAETDWSNLLHQLGGFIHHLH